MLGKREQNINRIAYTVSTALLLLALIFGMILHVYKYSEEEAFEILHRDTLNIKNDINLQMLSDRENLQTMADFASKLYKDGKDFELIFSAFKETGFVKNVGILMPGNHVYTKKGMLDATGMISFEEEKEKGTYISGRVPDITIEGKEVIRSVVPVKVNGETVAILFGIIELGTIAEKYADRVAGLDAKLYIIEGGTGAFIVDSRTDNPGNITELASNKFKKDFSYLKMLEDITEGNSGYSSFFSKRSEEYVYVHYSDLAISDWRIMLSRPEALVFAGARNTGGFMLIIFMSVVIIMVIYLALTMSLREKQARVNKYASLVRKSLLVYNSYSKGVDEALEIIMKFSGARSAFFIDTYGENYSSVNKAFADKLLNDKEREYFIKTLLEMAAKENDGNSTDIHTMRLVADSEMERTMPELCRFMRKNGIHNVHFTSVADEWSNVSVIGAINPKNVYVDMLFNDIAVCFAIAIYNKKHLDKTEEMALTDSLTGIENRMSFKENISVLKEKIGDLLACIYIDVNELHYFNNQYGHAAGDQMLNFIAQVLKNEFSGKYTYRMGGDEFLIFAEGIAPDILEGKMKEVSAQIEEMKYHISYGISYGEGKHDIESMVAEAERNMYADKAEYYQNKEIFCENCAIMEEINTIKTGNKDVDALLGVITSRYLGAYSVSLEEDSAKQLVAPEYYFNIKNEENKFSDILKQYIHTAVKPEFHRVLMSFISYDAIKEQHQKGNIPHITYVKADGESVTLSVYPISSEDEKTGTIWVFERLDN